MPFLNETVKLLNEKIMATLCFTTPQRIQCFGIVETIVKPVGTEEQAMLIRIPAFIDDEGEAHEVVPEDMFDLTLYHRIDNITNTLTKVGYGDSQGDIIETANMTLTVFAYRTRVRKPAQDIEAIIKDRFPDAAILLQDEQGNYVQKSVVRIGNSLFDRLAIEQKEYSNLSMDYPELSSFQMTYKIESTWNRGCLTLC